MVFFRIGGKFSKKDDRTSSTGSPTQSVSGSDTTTGLGSPTSAEREKKEKKETGRPSATASPTSRGQSMLSVNDFISKTKDQQRKGLKPSGPELIAYARYMGIDPVADHDLLWIAEESLVVPLPSDWTEHFDSNDRVFYYNTATRISSWTHPLEQIYREIYKTIVNFRNASMPPPERLERLYQLTVEVKQMEDDVHKEIAQWSVHEDEHGQRFYFNREHRHSTWTDPRPAKCQILYLRTKMLRLLQCEVGSSSQSFNDPKPEKSSHSSSSLASTAPLEEDPALKRSKVEDDSEARQPTLHRSLTNPMSDPGTNSDSSEDRKAKKRKKKKKKREAVRLGQPQKLGTSQSEPDLGSKIAARSFSGDCAGSSAGLRASLDDGLSMAGRTRAKGSVRLEPLGGT